MSRKTTAIRSFALCIVVLAAACSRSAPKRPTAHEILMGYLDHPASATSVGDSELVVKEIEWSPHPLSVVERHALAAIQVKQIREHWQDPRLRRVTVVFERPRRFGPIVFGGSDTALVFNVSDRQAH
ncbi:MAG: hypothetical protein ACHQSE_11185 [Gemmatimonadales bacterium]